MQALLEKAIELALIAHRGQLDKGGAPYILHPLSVMHGVDGQEAKIVALLHDALEDSALTLGELEQEGFSKDVLTALAVITKKVGQNYEEYIMLVKQNVLARTVKLADLADNMDERRLSVLNENDIKRLAKYRSAVKYLTTD